MNAKSLPYSHPERMGTIYTRVTGPGASDKRHNLDGELWELLHDNVPALIYAVSGSTSGVNLQAGSRVQYVHDGRISTHYLDVLALQPMMGRNFSREEDRPNGPRLRFSATAYGAMFLAQMGASSESLSW